MIVLIAYVYTVVISTHPRPPTAIAKHSALQRLLFHLLTESDLVLLAKDCDE